MSENLAILDHQQALKKSAGNEKLANDLLALLIKELPNYQEKLSDALQSDDKTTLKEALHKLHGGLQYVAAPALLHVVHLTDSKFQSLSDDELRHNVKKILLEIKKVLDKQNY